MQEEQTKVVTDDIDDPVSEETPKQKCEREHKGQIGFCSTEGVFTPGI